jgi:aldehyde dehydrogenase (NAD+)
MNIQTILADLGIGNTLAAASTGTQWVHLQTAKTRSICSPVDGKTITQVQLADTQTYNQVVDTAAEAFKTWRHTPAPKRGEIVRQIGDALRVHKANLGALVSYEMGKSLQEGLGEVQEMIDICDFAVGLSRQLHGLTMHSERPNHRMYEQPPAPEPWLSPLPNQNPRPKVGSTSLKMAIPLTGSPKSTGSMSISS